MDQVLLLSALNLLAQTLIRIPLFDLMGWLRERGVTSRRTLVIGGGTISWRLVQSLDQDQRYGCAVLGYVDRTQAPLSHGGANWTYLGSPERLGQLVDQLRIQCLIIGFGQGKDFHLVDQLRQSQARRPKVFVVPRLHEVGDGSTCTDLVGSVPLNELRLVRHTGVAWALKRGLDLTLALLGALVLGPVVATAAAALWAAGRRRIDCCPVIWSRPRVGAGGSVHREFRLRADRCACGRRDTADDRVATLVARLGLDHWPVLWNLLLGQRSLVGPAPTTPAEARHLAAIFPQYPGRYRVPVGVTGLAQVNGYVGGAQVEDQNRFDNMYVEHWSPWLDLRIVFRAVCRGLIGS
jgi:lipopolysaccharide/colanic/teichoic acid biosynthesis glycosyltransferase